MGGLLIQAFHLAKVGEFLNISTTHQYANLNEIKNSGHAPRSKWFSKLEHKFLSVFKNLSSTKGSLFRRANQAPMPKLSPEEYKFLLPFFQDSISELEKMLSIDLSIWR
ncbi:MAG: hypothetical protein ACI8YQ_000268 [Polaribacter sp.]|jgi:hypothetical protein